MVRVGALTTTESICARRLQVEQLRSAVLARRVLVGHSRLHDLLQPLALAGEGADRIVLLLKGVLQILHHSLLDLF